MGVLRLREFLARYPSNDDAANPLVLIPTFNNGPYASNMVDQLSKRGLTRYLLLDGGSDHPETREFLEELSQEGRVITLPDNPGPRYFSDDTAFFSALPQVFCVTDPDLQLHPSLPDDFVSKMLALGEECVIGKVGFALDLSGDLVEDTYFFGKKWHTVREWEQKFWQNPVNNSSGLTAYRAAIDTTFAVYNKRNFSREEFFLALRVAGTFTAQHLPWHRDDPFRDSIPAQFTDRPYSTWTRGHSQDRFFAAFEYAQQRIQDMESSFSWKITAPLRAVVKFGRKLKAATRR